MLSARPGIWNEPLTQVMAKAEVCPRIPLCRLVPKPDSCTAANDRRAAVLHWMTLSAASRPLGLRGRIDRISAGRVLRRRETISAHTTSPSFTPASGLGLSHAQDFPKQLMPGRLQ